jgi:hypothetical protein
MTATLLARCRPAPHNQRMPDRSDDYWDEGVHWFQKSFAINLNDAVGDRQTVTLTWPSLEYTGRSAAGDDIPMTSWRAGIGMYVGDLEAGDERRLEIGFLDLFTIPLYPGTVEALDAVSTDTADYIALFSDGALLKAVQEQFDSYVASGLVILDRAYVHPLLRAHDLGAWAAVQAIHDLTFGSEVLAVVHPAPIDRRPGLTGEMGAKSLARYWTKSGFETMKTCPRLMGLTTIGDALATARSSLANVSDIEFTLASRDLDIF